MSADLITWTKQAAALFPEIGGLSFGLTGALSINERYIEITSPVRPEPVDALYFFSPNG